MKWTIGEEDRECVSNCVPSGPLKGRLTFKLIAEAIRLEHSRPDTSRGACACDDRD